MKFSVFLVFFKIEIVFFVKNFWPHRSTAKGFSIKNLAFKYRLNISSSNISNGEVSNKPQFENDLEHNREETSKIFISKLSIKGGHWANRDFSEYKEVA